MRVQRPSLGLVLYYTLLSNITQGWGNGCGDFENENTHSTPGLTVCYECLL